MIELPLNACFRLQPRVFQYVRARFMKAIVALLGQISGKAIKVTLGVWTYCEREVMSPWRVGQCPHGWQAQIDMLICLASLLQRRVPHAA